MGELTTALSLAEGARLEAPAGKSLVMTVNGEEMPDRTGEYAGVIRLIAE